MDAGSGTSSNATVKPLPKKTTANVTTDDYRATNIDEAHARNQQQAFTEALTLLGSTNKAPAKETVVPKEETNVTGEQESGNTGTVTTIVTEQQGSSETQQTELSASTQLNIISTGLVLRESQTKKVMPLMLLLMIISSSARLIDDSLDSLKEQYDKWREKFSLRDTDLDDLIEEIPLQEDSAIVIPFPELGNEYMMETLPLAEPETVVISNPLPEPEKEGKIEQIPTDEIMSSTAIVASSIAALVEKVPDEYKRYGKCDYFAKSFATILTEEGIEYQIYRVDCNQGYFIYSDKLRESVGYFHYGIKVGDMIYDNLTTKGIEFEAWIKDLGVGINGVECNIVNSITSK